MKKLKIIIGISLLFILLGSATATDEIDSLKSPAGYDNIAAGIADNSDNENIYIYIGDMEYNKGIFDNTTDYTVTLIEDNIYKFVDTNLKDSGVQEKIKINNKEYLVSIIDEESVDTDFDAMLNSIKEFNKLNNFEPEEI